MSDFPEGAFHGMPGYLFRRLHQIAVARFTADAEAFGITPLQWAALHAIGSKPGIDQSALSRDIVLDTSTVAGVIYRLEDRGLIERRASPSDRRLRVLFLTQAGTQLLARATPAVMEMQEWLLEPLSPAEQKQFLKLMRKVVHRPGESSS